MHIRVNDQACVIGPGRCSFFLLAVPVRNFLFLVCIVLLSCHLFTTDTPVRDHEENGPGRNRTRIIHHIKRKQRMMRGERRAERHGELGTSRHRQTITSCRVPSAVHMHVHMLRLNEDERRSMAPRGRADPVTSRLA